MADYERQVAAQLGIAELLLIFREFGSGGFPKPRQVLGVGIVFAGLSVVQVASEPWQRLASYFGWFIVLGLGVSAVAKSPDLLGSVVGLGGDTRPLFPQSQPQTQAQQYGGPAPMVA